MLPLSWAIPGKQPGWRLYRETWACGLHVTIACCPEAGLCKRQQFLFSCALNLKFDLNLQVSHIQVSLNVNVNFSLVTSL